MCGGVHSTRTWFCMSRLSAISSFSKAATRSPSLLRNRLLVGASTPSSASAYHDDQSVPVAHVCSYGETKWKARIYLGQRGATWLLTNTRAASGLLSSICLWWWLQSSKGKPQGLSSNTKTAGTSSHQHKPTSQYNLCSTASVLGSSHLSSRKRLKHSTARSTSSSHLSYQTLERNDGTCEREREGLGERREQGEKSRGRER